MNEAADVKQAIGNVAASLQARVHAEGLDARDRLFERAAIDSAMAAIEARSISQFELAISHPTSMATSAILHEALPDSPLARFLFRESMQTRRHIEFALRTWDDGSCVGDKSRTIMSALARFYLDGVRIEFDYTQRYTFHLPTRILNAHDEVVGFFEGLCRLSSGDPGVYLHFISIFAERHMADARASEEVR